uniref:Uncharacterized protein n=1 Tax=Ixodes ricinus TaxID=34613 RepID=A0A6B0V5J4_IXORI
MPFSFNFEVPGADGEPRVEHKHPTNEQHAVVKRIAPFEEVKPRLEHEHVHESLEKTVLDLTSMKVEFLVSGQMEQLLKGDLKEAADENLDLVPSVYEGGMKVWECSIDLAEYVESSLAIDEDTRILENKQVLDLVTIPNAFANIGSEVYRRCRFLAGDWSLLLEHLKEQCYDFILTSETIYSSATYQDLIRIFKKSLKPHGLILVAAKTCYFGVGGGTRQFEETVASDGTFKSRVVFVTDTGVQREILELRRKSVDACS